MPLTTDDAVRELRAALAAVAGLRCPDSAAPEVRSAYAAQIEFLGAEVAQLEGCAVKDTTWFFLVGYLAGQMAHDRQAYEAIRRDSSGE